MMEFLKGLWADPTVHQLIVSLALTVLMVVGTKLSAKTGAMGVVGKLIGKLAEWLGSNPKHVEPPK
jgi:uncharacterized membrane protein